MSISDREQMARDAWVRRIIKKFVNPNLKYIHRSKIKYDGIKLTLFNEVATSAQRERFEAVAHAIGPRLQWRRAYHAVVETVVKGPTTRIILIIIRPKSNDGRPWWQKLLLEC